MNEIEKIALDLVTNIFLVISKKFFDKNENMIKEIDDIIFDLIKKSL